MRRQSKFFYFYLFTGILVFNSCVKADSQGPDFSFVFMTDLHLKPDPIISAAFDRVIDTVNTLDVDFVISFVVLNSLDVQHKKYIGKVRSYRSMGIAPIVRVAAADATLVCQAVNAGAQGIVAPYLEKEDEVESLVYALKYRPLKGMLLEQYKATPETMPDALRTYLATYNSGNVAIANIESVPALNNLENLLAVKGLDAVFIGPHDLSVSMGLPEEYDHPDFEKAVAYIINSCRSKDISVGIHFSLEPDRQVKWAQQGANIIVHSSDGALFGQRLTSDMKHIRNMLGDTHHFGEPDSVSAII